MPKILILVSALFLLTCKNDKVGTVGKIEITPGISNLYDIDTKASRCTWKLDSQGVHTIVDVPLSSGRFSVLEGVPAAADFVMDFHALSIGNMNPDLAMKKAQMLKDSAFLSCSMYPVGRGIMTRSEKAGLEHSAEHRIGFDLKIKEMVRPVQMEADLQISENEVRLSGKPTVVNLVEWGIAHHAKASVQLLLVFKRIYPQQN